MNLKKNPKYDLNKYSGLYFALGLTLVLFLTWRAIEWKNYDKSEFDYLALNVDEDDDEEVPITEQLKPPPPPPPPPPAPEVIEIVEDEEEVEETIIESTETDEEEIIEVEDIEIIEEVVEETVIFAVVEDVPVYPGCEKKPKNEHRSCFEQGIQNHIRRTFRYPEIAQEMGIQGRVNVQFTVMTDGSIGNILVRGPDKNLEREAQRIMQSLPKMTPGKQRGRPVKVPFSIPVNFRLQ